MATIYRYSKNTIQGQAWECSLVINDDSITLYETHTRLKTSKVIKDIVKPLTHEEAMLYKERNKDYHVETYNRPITKP